MSGEPEGPGEGMSWGAMLGWMALACAVAGLVAYRLVAPFFHHR